MPVLILPNVFINGTVADADLVNQNNNAIANVVNALDHLNVGALGFWANQLRPGNTPQGTFGGAPGYAGYRFSAYEHNVTPLTIEGVSAQSVDLWKVVDAQNVPKVWIDKDYHLHATGDFHVGTLNASVLNVGQIHGGGARFTGNVEARDLIASENVHARDVIATLDVRARDLLASRDLNVSRNASIDALYTPSIHMGTDGDLRFGLQGALTQHADEMYLVAGAQRPGGTGGQWVARHPQASMVEVSRTTSGTRFYHNQNLIQGNNFTPQLVALIDGFGLLIADALSSRRIRLPYGFGNIGTYQSGMYIASGFYHDHARGGFVAETGLAVGIFLGIRPTVAARFELTYNTGLTPNSLFTPAIIFALGTGGTNQMVCYHGVQPRSPATSTLVGPTIFGGPDVPANTTGSNGDFFFRNNNATGTAIYKRIGGSWQVIVP